MNDTYYFSHDYNARTDPKIKRLLARHGMVGYGLFWSIVEDLYNNANALPLDCDGIAYDLRSDVNLVHSVIHDFNLFQIDGQTFGSVSVERRLSERKTKSNSAKNSANIRWQKYRESQLLNANAMQTHSDGNAIKEKKEKEIKENEITQDIVNIWTSDFNFLKSDSVWFERQIEMKYKIQTKDLDHMLSQYWLSLQKSNFSGNIKQIRAGLIKWINTWLEKNKTEKPQEQKRTVKVLS